MLAEMIAAVNFMLAPDWNGLKSGTNVMR